jgi:hypothetical protein
MLQIRRSSCISSPIQKSGKQKSSIIAKTIHPASEIFSTEMGVAVDWQ